MDSLIAQREQDMNQSDDGHKAFKRVLQNLKGGTMGINDAFICSETNGSNKCIRSTNGMKHNREINLQNGRPFLFTFVELGCTPGNHVPYFEYAKTNNADFKVWDTYGKSFLHLVLDFDTQCAPATNLAWLLENTEAKDLIIAPKRAEGDPKVLEDQKVPWTTKLDLQAILRRHGSSHTG